MGPAELEFKKKHKLSWSQQMEVVVAVLLQAQHSAWIDWVIEVSLLALHRHLSWSVLIVQVLEFALASRQEIIIAIDGMRGPRDGEEEAAEDERGVRHIGAPSKEALDKFGAFGMSLSSSKTIGDADEQTYPLIKKNTRWRYRLIRTCASCYSSSPLSAHSTT